MSVSDSSAGFIALTCDQLRTPMMRACGRTPLRRAVSPRKRTLTTTMRHEPRLAPSDARPRQLPTDTSRAVPTRKCQSDSPSLPWDARHPTLETHGANPRRALTFCSMSVVYRYRYSALS
jgi:hypothetical protein